MTATTKPPAGTIAAQRKAILKGYDASLRRFRQEKRLDWRTPGWNRDRGHVHGTLARLATQRAATGLLELAEQEEDL